MVGDSLLEMIMGTVDGTVLMMMMMMMMMIASKLNYIDLTG